MLKTKIYASLIRITDFYTELLTKVDLLFSSLECLKTPDWRGVSKTSVKMLINEKHRILSFHHCLQSE